MSEPDKIRPATELPNGWTLLRDAEPGDTYSASLVNDDSTFSIAVIADSPDLAVRRVVDELAASRPTEAGEIRAYLGEWKGVALQ